MRYRLQANSSLIRWLVVAAVVVALDQWTKHLASSHLVLHQPVALIPSLNFTLMHNPGAAFSFLSGAGGWQRWFFAGLAIAVSVFIFLWLRTVPRGRVWLPLALALLLGGAIGNLWDRLLLGVVIDFVDVYYGDWHWPAFNVADSAICVGAGILLVTTVYEDTLGRKARPKPGTEV